MNLKYLDRFKDRIYRLIFLRGKQQVYLIKNGLFRDNLIYTQLTVEEKILLHKIIKRQKHKLICAEIGSFLGASSCFIANAIPENSKLYCIDTWKSHNIRYSADDPKEGRDTFKEFCLNTKKYRHKIIEIRDWSSQAIKKLKKYRENIDLLFLDGDHHYKAVKNDWELYSPLLKSGSLIVFHDTGWAEGVKKVINDSVLKTVQEIASLPNMSIFKMK